MVYPCMPPKGIPKEGVWGQPRPGRTLDSAVYHEQLKPGPEIVDNPFHAVEI